MVNTCWAADSNLHSNKENRKTENQLHFSHDLDYQLMMSCILHALVFYSSSIGSYYHN